MDIVDAFIGFARQPRSVEVVDIGHLGVEQVVAFDHDASAARDAIADLAVPERRRVRSHAVVFDERPRAEVAQAETPEHRSLGLH